MDIHDEIRGEDSVESENEVEETTSPKTEKAPQGSAFSEDSGDHSPAPLDPLPVDEGDEDHLAVSRVIGER